jgi:hypothetical protein
MRKSIGSWGEVPPLRRRDFSVCERRCHSHFQNDHARPRPAISIAELQGQVAYFVRRYNETPCHSARGTVPSKQGLDSLVKASPDPDLRVQSEYRAILRARCERRIRSKRPSSKALATARTPSVELAVQSTNGLAAVSSWWTPRANHSGGHQGPTSLTLSGNEATLCEQEAIGLGAERGGSLELVFALLRS